MKEVKFHTKPTQIDRQDPIKIYEMFGVIDWLYYLPKNGYYVLFKVDNGISTATLAGFDKDDNLTTLFKSDVEIHTRKDLVDYVHSWGRLTTFDIVKVQEDILKIELAQSLHVL